MLGISNFGMSNFGSSNLPNASKPGCVVAALKFAPVLPDFAFTVASAMILVLSLRAVDERMPRNGWRPRPQCGPQTTQRQRQAASGSGCRRGNITMVMVQCNKDVASQYRRT